MCTWFVGYLTHFPPHIAILIEGEDKPIRCNKHTWSSNRWQMEKAFHSTIISKSLVSTSAQSFLHSTPKFLHAQNKKYPLLVVSCSGENGEPRKSKKTVRKSQKAPRSRPLIKIPTSDRKWGDEWTASYVLTLRELCLNDLAHEDGELDKPVSIGLSIQKVIDD